MARPKAIFLKDLAEKAQSDLSIIDHHKIAFKLQAIVSMSKFSVGMVAEIMGVTAQTIWRWASLYRKNGIEGLYQRPRRAKPSKLTLAQKAEILSWLDAGKTAKGENTHWTLERLRHAITEQFGITLGINTIWVWLHKEGRKQKTPRPRHYAADKEAQEAFKKTPRFAAGTS